MTPGNCLIAINYFRMFAIDFLQVPPLAHIAAPSLSLAIATLTKRAHGGSAQQSAFSQPQPNDPPHAKSWHA